MDFDNMRECKLCGDYFIPIGDEEFCDACAEELFDGEDDND